MIAGERLFVHVGLTSSADEIYSQPIPVLSRKVPGLPADLDKVMLRALAIDPNARYQTANELQEALLRCAHKNGLMLSAPELANQLRDVCGPAAEWRDVEGREPTGTAALGGGTEVYDIEEGTEQLDADDLADDDRDLVSVVRELSAPIGPANEVVARRRLKPPTVPVPLGKLQGLELTSMIKIGGPAKNEGARPLVDLDQLPPHKRTGEVSTISPLADEIDEASVVARPPTAAMPPAQRRPPPAHDPRTETVPPFRSRAPRLRQALAVVGLLALGVGIAVAIGLTGPTVSTATRPGATPPTPGSPANQP